VSWLETIVLGLVQGLTEFLPISSSAHLRIVAAIAGWQDPGAAFTAVTQIGTELAVLVYFREDILAILRAWGASLRGPLWRSEDPAARMGWLIIVGTIPIAVLGVLLQDQIHDAFRDLRLIALTLIVFGVLLGFADATARAQRRLEQLTPRHGLLYGLAQALALIPGVSRSGGTITAGLLMGYTREAAARYAFLLAVPAVLASGIFELKDLGSTGAGASGAQTALATVIAFVVGLAVIRWLMAWISSRSFAPFVAYRIALGLLVLVLVLTGALDANAGPDL
jgi:undecaprenyl-diphosphatase